jgi:hypothetical protein
MKIKTIENLEDALDKHLAWRKQEMLNLKTLIDRGDDARIMLIRAGMALLCAHFEGFIKDASYDYLSFVANQNICYKDLQEVFSIWKIHSLIEECAKSSKYSIQARVLEKYNALSSEPFSINKKSMINTHSNPSTEVLKELLLTLGVETDIFRTKANYIDSSLLANRHSIVHGERTNLAYDDFSVTFDIIMRILDDYKDFLIDAAAEEAYKKQVN